MIQFYTHRCLCLFVQVSGSKFYYLKNEAVLLEMALINWTLLEVMKRGFTPLTTPEIARSSIVEKCGFQPRGANTQVCYILCLIGRVFRGKLGKYVMFHLLVVFNCLIF